MNVLDFDMDIQEAISAPRVSFIEPDQLAVEPTISGDVVDALAARGHNILSRERIGNAHGLVIEYDGSGKPERFTGGADTRGAGLAKGF